MKIQGRRYLCILTRDLYKMVNRVKHVKCTTRYETCEIYASFIFCIFPATPNSTIDMLCVFKHVLVTCKCIWCSAMLCFRKVKTSYIIDTSENAIITHLNRMELPTQLDQSISILKVVWWYF